MEKMKRIWIYLLLFICWGCSGDRTITNYKEEVPVIYPDYAEVTVPFNIAPLNFSICSDDEAYVIFKYGSQQFVVDAENGDIIIPEKKWKSLLAGAKGQALEVTVVKKEQGRWEGYIPFHIYVAEEPVDKYLAYRLIEPGYALWNQMGIYQRDLESYEESAIYENKMTGYNCVNCHSFCNRNPEQMLFHMRGKTAGTVLLNQEHMDFLNTKAEQTMSALVYPFWHPSGKYIAFSVNKTTQDMHPTQRTEVYDTASDVVVYDIEKRAILSAPEIFTQGSFETFPTFSPDGKTLYYCSAPACPMPDSIRQLKYSLCRLSFDASSGTFGSTVDTLYNACLTGKSISFPRVSPDGNHVLCTISGYGTFPIWHKDADLYLIDLKTRKGHYPEALNSDDTESYHTWSSNGRWIVFSSRRLDGLYTRPFFAYMNESGEISKPFLLPQKKTKYYTALMKSYNIPEFITGKVENQALRIRKLAEKEATSVSFRLVEGK